MIYSSTHRGRWHLRQVAPGVSTSSSALHSSASRISHRERGHEDTERLEQSMGAVGTSADNALAESFNATLKHETLRGARRFDGALACRLTVFRWTARYNTRRRHSANGHQAPIAYEQVSAPGDKARSLLKDPGSAGSRRCPCGTAWPRSSSRSGTCGRRRDSTQSTERRASARVLCAASRPGGCRATRATASRPSVRGLVRRPCDGPSCAATDPVRSGNRHAR